MQTRLYFFNDTTTTEIYTLSLHDALPILELLLDPQRPGVLQRGSGRGGLEVAGPAVDHPPAGDIGQRRQRVGAQCRSEEHTSELQSRQYLVCRLLLEKTNSFRYCDLPLLL